MHLRGNRRWVSMVFGAHVFLYFFRSTYFRLFFHLLFSFFLGGGGGYVLGGRGLAIQSPLPSGSAPGCYNSPSSKLCFVLTIIQTNIPATNDSRIVKAMMGRQLLMAFQISLFLIHDEWSHVRLDLRMRTTPGESKILMKGRIILYVLSSSLCTGRIRWTLSLRRRSWSWDLFSACVLKFILVLVPALSMAQHLFKARSKT